MYIEPNTTIKIYHNVPLDSTYEHTIYFGSISAQNSYFHADMNILKYTLTRQSYQRVERGYMRVQLNAEDLYDCNYLAFQNTNFGNKWFYAFIKGVEYVNNEVSQIEFEIDVMQTYFFDVELRECFVEREHTADDTIGMNLNPEPVELGDYVSDGMDGTNELAPTSIILVHNGVDSIMPDIGNEYGGLYSGSEFKIFPNNAQGITDLQSFLSSITVTVLGWRERIVGLFVMPTKLVAQAGSFAPKSFDITKAKSITQIGDYVPRNKKLLTYPYNFLAVNNNQGTELEYRYEFFTSDDCEFICTGDTSMSSHAILAPYNYKGIPVNYEEMLVMDCSYQVPFCVASFSDLVGNSGISSALNNAGNNEYKTANSTKEIASPTAGRGFKGASMGVDLATNVVSTLAHSTNYHGGSGGIVTTLSACGIRDFMFLKKHITPLFARQIDDFFDKYGYNTQRLKVPNRHVRENWTYTKTKNCVLSGNAPVDDIDTICRIYDKGITFWSSPYSVRNYSLSNNTL